MRWWEISVDTAFQDRGLPVSGWGCGKDSRWMFEVDEWAAGFQGILPLPVPYFLKAFPSFGPQPHNVLKRSLNI